MVAKLTDVAELAGVSPTTVSRVINKRATSHKTIDKVHAAMQELNYKPNNLARGLKENQPSSLALIFPNISNIFTLSLSNDLRTSSLSRVIKPSFVTVSTIPTRKRTIWKCFPPTNVMVSSRLLTILV